MARFLNPTIQYFSDAGLPLSMGTVSFFETETLTLAPIWQDADLSISAENPMPLDTYGRPETPIFLGTDVYRVQVKDSTGAVVDDQDPVTGAISQEEFDALETSLTDQIDTLTNQINSIVSNLYPIGGLIFTTDVNFDPATIYGGTWERTLKGRAPFGYDPDNAPWNTAGATGGASSKTLSTTEIPSHTHAQWAESGAGDLPQVKAAAGAVPSGLRGQTDGAPISNREAVITGATGGGTAFSLLNPYEVVCIWKRTA